MKVSLRFEHPASGKAIESLASKVSEEEYNRLKELVVAMSKPEAEYLMIEVGKDKHYISSGLLRQGILSIIHHEG